MKKLFFVFVCVAVLFCAGAFACTDIQLITKDGAVIVGRSFEWGGVLKTNKDGSSYIYSPFNWGFRLWPAGMKVTSTKPDNKPGLSFTTGYAYFGFVGDPSSPFVSDGQNTEGLTLEMLNYPGYAEYQEVTPQDKHVMATDDFGAWILGNFANTDEIKKELPKITVWGKPNPVMMNQIPQFHFAVHDRSGKSIIIEYTKKKLNIYDNTANVMTNSPDYAWMTDNLKTYVNLAPDNVVRMLKENKQLVPFGQGSGMLGMPGDYTPPSRFVKAAYLVYYAKQPDNAAEGVRTAIHILNNVDIPFGATREKTADGVYAQDYTQMKVIKDLKNNIWYFDTYGNIGSICKIDLNEIFANPQKYLTAKAVSDIIFPGIPQINDLIVK